MNICDLRLNNMANIVFICLFLLLAMPVEAADAPVKLSSIEVDLRDKAKLQRGAKIFMNYCSGCHSLQYMRYNKMAKDLGLTTFDGEVDKDLLHNNLIFTRANVHDPIQISMPKQDAEQWFGIVPPDLTLTARERGAEWIYTYLKSFYVDKSRPFGANNALVPDVAMPNVLAPLQGTVIAAHKDANGHERSDFSLVLIAPGSMGQQQFDSTLNDLVTFLVYVGEPSKLIRYQMGFLVLIFLIVLAAFAYKLKKQYWRNINKI